MNGLTYTDYHVHTRYSPDSDASIKKYILRAKELGLDYLVFTDHMDMGAVVAKFEKRIDYDEYFTTMKNYEKEYGIPIRIGVEIGYEKNHKEEIDDLLNKYPFDFVMASIHYGDGKDLYSGDFFHGKSQYQSYFTYFELVLEMVENFSNFEVVGHLDHIVRYGPFEDKTYDYKDYKDIIDNILKIIIKKEKGIEINTSGLRGEAKATFPNEMILKRYKELGGKIITLGSDAHFNEEYYAGIVELVDLVKSLGFTEISSFEKRKVKGIYI